MKLALAALCALALGLALYVFRLPANLDSSPVGLEGNAPSGAVSPLAPSLEQPVLEALATEVEGTRSAARMEAPVAASTTGVWLHGRVVRESSAETAEPEPIAGARVRFVLIDGVGKVVEWRTLSGPDGSFALSLGELPSPPPLARVEFDAVLSAIADGFQPNSLRLDVEPKSLGRASIEIALRAGPVLTGRVVGPGGSPCPRAAVTLSSGSGGKATAYARRACDEDGSFVLALPKLQALELFANAEGLLPGRIDLSRRALAEGGDLGEIPLERGLALAGTLVCACGEPIPGMELRATKEAIQGNEARVARMSRGGWAKTDGLGGFRIEGLSPGSYTLSEGGTSYGSFTAGDEGIALVSMMRYLTVRVIDEEGNALPGVELTLDAGVLSEGEFDVVMSVMGYTEEADGEMVFGLGASAWHHVIVAASSESGPWIEKTFDPSPAVCMERLELVLPSEVSMGTLRVELVDPETGAIIPAKRLAVYSSRVGGAVFAFSDSGPHELPADRYEAVLETQRPFDFPVEVADFVVREDAETLLRRKLAHGGLMSLELSLAEPRSASDKGTSRVRAQVRVQEAGGSWRRVNLRSQSRMRLSMSIEPDQKLYIDHVYARGSINLEVLADGYEPFTREVGVFAGETTDVAVVLHAH